MRKILFIITCLALLTGSGAWATSELNQLHMNWNNNEVVLKADLSEAFQYKHEIAEAKDGKPFRIVIDMFPAIHNLPQKSFTDLPNSIVKSIRTSQYSTDPDQVSRIVLDLAKSAVYRIEKKGSSVYIYIPDSDGHKFTAWSSTASHPKPAMKPEPSTMAKAELKAQPKSKQAPVKTELAKAKTQTKSIPMANKPTENKEVVKKAKPVFKKSPVVPLGKEYTYLKPSSSNDLDRQFAFGEAKWIKSNAPKKVHANLNSEPRLQRNGKAATKPITEPKAIAAKETKKAEPKKNEPGNNKSEKSLATNKELADKVIEKSKPASNEAKPVQNQPTNDFKKVKKSELADNGPKKTETKPKSAELASVDKKDEKSQSTSRFRRKPAFPTKLKGTIVAEFPTRMVIKYKPSSFKDPFETLIREEGSGSDSPIAKRIPDVETSRLVGVLESSDGSNSALLEDMDGIGYILNTGDKVKKGYVSKIYADKALFQLFEYGWSRTVALRLNKGE